jgi:hypothetical protein
MRSSLLSMNQCSVKKDKPKAMSVQNKILSKRSSKTLKGKKSRLLQEKLTHKNTIEYLY